MAAKMALVEVKDRGWLNGFGPLWRKENHAWWGSWSWLAKVLVWMSIIDGLMAVVAFAEPEVEAAAGEAADSALMTYFLIATILPTSVLIIFGHEDLIDERKLGTAAWVLSKPVSRAAFLLARLSTNALGVLVTMVLAPGIVAYFVFKAGTGITLSIPGFLAGLGLVFLFVICFLALTLMLGTLFHTRGPVIAIPLAIISLSSMLVSVPWLGKIMPLSMIFNPVPGHPSPAIALALGQPLPTAAPIIGTVLLTILFVLTALVRFEREEF